MQSNDPYMIETPVEDLLIEVEWQGMVDQSKGRVDQSNSQE